MRIRTIKPSFWSSATIASVSRDARLVFIGLWNIADDEGRLLGGAKGLAGALFEHDEDVDGKRMSAWLDELETRRLIERYSVKGVAHICIPGFGEHQKIDKRFPSRLPPPPDLVGESPRLLSDGSEGSSRAVGGKSASEVGSQKSEVGSQKLECGRAAPPKQLPPAPLRPVIVVEPPPPPVECLEERAERAQSAAIVKAGVRDQFAARNARAGAALGRPQTPQELLAMRVLVVDGEIVVRAGEGVTGQPLTVIWAKRYPSLDGKGSPQRASIAEVLVRAWVASCRWGWSLDAGEYLSRWARILAEESQKVRYAWERDGGTAGVGDPDRARARRRHHELQGLGRDLPPFDTWFSDVWARGHAEDIAPSTPAGSGARPAGPRSGGVLRPADIDAQMAMAHADRDEGAGAAGLALLRAAQAPKPVQVRAVEGDDFEVQPCSMTQPNLFVSPPATFRCIAADPPWQERGGGKVKRGADRHYGLLSYAEIVDVMRDYFTAVGRPDPTGSLLWLWATSNHLPGALEVMRDLGFRYVTNLVWTKTTKNGLPHVGLGQRTRQRHELLLLGVMGSVAVPTPKHRPDSVIEAPRGKHSAKPQAAYDRIERACDGPRLEVFAREARHGWTVVGNQAPAEAA